jgi:hypothetical protein
MCNLKGVIMIEPESFTDRRELVAKEAKLFGVGGLQCFKG